MEKPHVLTTCPMCCMGFIGGVDCDDRGYYTICPDCESRIDLDIEPKGEMENES